MAQSITQTNTTTVEKFFPLAVVGFAMFLLVLFAIPPATGPSQYDYYEFGKIPILDGGRIKPLDTFARVSLQKVAGTTAWSDSWASDWAKRKDSASSAKSHSASEWMLELLAEHKLGAASGAGKTPVFRIDTPAIRDTLKLAARDGLRYSFDEIAGTELSPVPEEAAQGMTVNLAWLTGEATRASALKPEQQEKLDQRILELVERMSLFRRIDGLRVPLTVPPPKEDSKADWLPLAAFLRSEEKTADYKAFDAILTAYADRKPEEFNRAVKDYKVLIADRFAPELNKAAVETAFNHLDPFFVCKIFYLMIGIIGVFSWLGWFEPLRRTAFFLGILTLGVHTFAIVTRMYLQGRPPVTNLYSSAVFIGYGCTIMALILEAIFRRGVGNVVAAILGFATMQIAQFLADNSGDTLEMMQAVLDTNFWLATHVTCVSLGYTATLLAGAIGGLYLVMGVCTPLMTAKLEKSFTQMLYGVLCFATLLSFTGTVLGGIWADYSWGRFWGWDPKENGAVLVVLWNVLILHARWSGQVKMRGIAVLSQFGNMVTVWSWFGTNQLGIGLHAYGFSAKLAYYCAVSWIALTMIAALGLIPKSMWWSVRRSNRPQPPVEPVSTATAADRVIARDGGPPSIRKLRKK